MIVTKSAVELTAQHSASSHFELTETLRAWIGAARPDFESMNKGTTDKGTTATISAAALASLKAQPPVVAPAIASGEAQAIQDAIDQTDQDPIIHLIRLMVEMLTGHKIGTVSVRGTSGAAAASSQGARATAGSAPAAPARAGYGIEYDRRLVHSESERTDVQASGTVLTADGRQISFQLALSMQRSYQEESSASLRAGDGVRKDPLVINYAAESATLQVQRFSFELDSRGASDQIPMLASGSGFLALDLNNNGVIDSGKELFGATSGKGFADLAAYDANGSGWIDAADPVFGRLRIWTPDGKGGGDLSSLAGKNIGALSLANAATAFELRDGANRSLGAVRATGVFLREDGSAGSVQQVDLTV